jgi:SAM-dependent methyltransferase
MHFRRVARFASDLVRVPAVRRSLWLRASRPTNLFQPYNDTSEDRYPGVFAWLQREVGDSNNVRLLSFGCSVGDEVFSLRRYFPEANIVGIDISRGNISECRRRQQRQGDERMRFLRAGSVDNELSDHYDAVLCMAVLRHGELGYSRPWSCKQYITFEAFDATVSQLARCLKLGGYLVIEHSNFRFRDSSSASQFDMALRRRLPSHDRPTPLYGPDNILLADQEYDEVIFRKKA